MKYLIKFLKGFLVVWVIAFVTSSVIGFLTFVRWVGDTYGQLAGILVLIFGVAIIVGAINTFIRD